MGIPKFYRWLSERYPLLNQKLTLTEGPPDIDNLYLDMNGIIHNCTHANRTDIGGVTEEEMMLKVFDYMEKLIQIVRPQKLLFMAIDGVAPRAKMNQQRSRRFKSAMERLKNEEEKRSKGEIVPDDPFDSNCITPGTEFMARLGKHLRFFVRRKMADDPLWQKPNVVFSGHEVPGEGEHKIMEYIRWEKRQPNYQPNQRHCMYGLDADLVMLSLVSHEPHFCLLREVVSYTGQNRGQPARETLDNPCADNFILFQIGLLREYFELEFGTLTLPFPLDLERVVDDYVLLCMLVGNDFLPPLPTLDIAEGALNKLMDLYKELLPRLGGYLTYAGDLDRRRLEVLLERLGQMELQTLEERAQDAEFMESKRAKRNARNGAAPAQRNELDAGARSRAPAAGGLLNQPLEPEPTTAAAVQAPTMMSREARQMMMAGNGDQGLQEWKDRYYSAKLHAHSPEERRQVGEHYIAGLHWVLEYYYRGVASWDWYYPYHYAPMASDMTNLDGIQVAFAQGNPFRPFEQLLAVLPAASCKLLPPAFRVLMTEPESPILDFYPGSFEVDMEGKRADWEGVVLVPFVDEGRLLQAVRSIRTTLLSQEELSRNQYGQIQIFQYSRNSSETSYCVSTMAKHFQNIKMCHSRCLEKPPPPPLPVGGKGFVPTLVPGTRVGLQTPTGMPTLKSLQVRPALRNVGVNVLGTPSRKDSLVLSLKDLREALGGAVLSAEQVAQSGLLGARAYINWPYLQEARVTRVSDRAGQSTFDSKGTLKVQRWQPQEAQRWETDAAQLASTFLTRSGIDVGKVDLVVGVKVCLGYIRHGDGTIEKTYSKDEVQVPLQAVIRQRPQQASGGSAATDGDVPAYQTLHEGMQVVFLGKHHYGSMATVLSDLGKGLAKEGKQANGKGGAAAANGHYRLLVHPVSEQVGIGAVRTAKRTVERFAVKFYSSGEVANRVGMSPRLLGRITGNMWARDGDDRYDLGLAIKTSARDVCVPGFSQPTDDGNGWMYSAAIMNILQEYRKLHAWIWNQLVKSENEGAGDLRLDSLLPGLTPTQRKDKVREVTEWLKSTPLARRPLVKLGAKVLSDEGVKALQTTVAPVPARPPPAAEYENVPPALLLPPYTPGAEQVKLAVQGGPFELGDRVVCVSGKGSPPYGLRGTIIGIYDEACEVVFDEEFGGGSNLGGRVIGKCGAFVPTDLLLSVNKPADIMLATDQVPVPRQSARPAAHNRAAAAAPPQNPPAASASQAAAKAMQQRMPPSPCVPASVSVTAPVSPPVPSLKLLGAAKRAGGHPQQQQPSQQQHLAAPGSGQALLQQLTRGNGVPAAQGAADIPAAVNAVDSMAAAAASAAFAAANSRSHAAPAGSFAQLQKLVPNARVGAAGPPPHQPQPAPVAQQQLQPPAPPMPQQLFYGTNAPRHASGVPHHAPGIRPPVGVFQPYTPQQYPPQHMAPFLPGPQAHGGMAAQMMGLPGAGPSIPVPFMAPPPPVPQHLLPGQGRPNGGPPRSAGGAGGAQGRQQHRAPGTGNGNGPSPHKQTGGAGQNRGGGGQAGTVQSAVGVQAAPPAMPAISDPPAASAAPLAAPAQQLAAVAAAADATPAAGLLPAPKSHPIDMDEDDSAFPEAAGSGTATPARAVNGASPARAFARGTGSGDEGRSGSASGRSARLPPAEAGRGFTYARGKPPPPPNGGVAGHGSGGDPPAPGSLGGTAMAGGIIADPQPRPSLEGVQAGQALLRTLQAGSGLFAANASGLAKPGAPVEDAQCGAVRGCF